MEMHSMASPLCVLRSVASTLVWLYSWINGTEFVTYPLEQGWNLKETLMEAKEGQCLAN